METRTSTEFSRSSGTRGGWNDFLCQSDSPKPIISPERLEKGVGDADIVTRCRYYFFESQLCFASWQSHWERLARTAYDRLSKHAECSMSGTKRCFIISYMQLRSSCLRSTG